MGTPEQRRLGLQLQGLVQGVGFRPFVHRLARRLALRGWVRNGADGVELELEGRESDLQSFLLQLQAGGPPRCRIDQLRQQWGEARGDLPPFRIAEPEAGRASGLAAALVSPDLALCPACLAELADPRSRRHRYPFISCTDCGPRYSVLRQLPFERPHTSLAAFPLCEACRAEYGDPADRRFHAQTISCPVCGPRLSWQTAPGARDAAAAADSERAIAAAAALLRQGGIVALQGIGGFQLLVDPHNPAAVAELRRRKGRPDKPLALLASEAWLRRCCRVGPEEAAQWWSPAAPIVLLRRRGSGTGSPPLAAAVAPDSPWLGVMRPASGLHQLLLAACGEVLVATSANRSGEPLVCDAARDGERLFRLADGVLRHDLPIVNPIDDSVLRIAAGGPLILRLGRGLAPLALDPPPTSASASGVPAPAPRLALGAQLKGSLALQLPQALLLSPDLGDGGSCLGARHLQDTLARWLDRHGLTPASVACDAHPGYSSHRLAAASASRLAVPLQTVQHHHAHLLAVMAEHALAGERIGVAWDGAGQGDDGSLWGGEALAVSAGGYRRLAHLRPFPLPGGERALREPRRAALGLLVCAYGDGWRDRLAQAGGSPWLAAFTAEELAVLEQALRRGLNSPLCSSVGRLFDAVAALLGLQQVCSYEAQAAMALEGLAAQAPVGAMPLPGYAIPLGRDLRGGAWQWDWRPMLAALLRDQADPAIPRAAIALAVHRALAQAIADLAVQLGEALPGGQILLSGGCFQNALLLEQTIAALARRGVGALWSQRLPCNDAALAVGQLLRAPTTSITRAAPWADPHVPRRAG